ncbi:MAG: RNA polymerase sigma factor [Acidobacteriota bacterium]
MSSNYPYLTITDHAKIFVDNYEQLLRRARYLCQGDIMTAEDLVQTAYIQFVTYQPPLNTIDNPLAYLYRLVGNVHKNQLIRASAQKRGGFGKTIDLPIIEDLVYDPIIDRQQAHDLLIEIAHFASERRQTSKAGAVLILRFLLGYFPKEIAQLLTISIFAVNNLIMRGRQELKDSLKNPVRKPQLRCR